MSSIKKGTKNEKEKKKVSFSNEEDMVYSIPDSNENSKSDIDRNNIIPGQFSYCTRSSQKKIEECTNRCIGCGIDMGAHNARQYCMKSYCPYEIIY